MWDIGSAPGITGGVDDDIGTVCPIQQPVVSPVALTFRCGVDGIDASQQATD
jgi:hypothetical protein